METLKRSELPSGYEEMMKTECHHDHEIVEINGAIRWKENEVINRILKDVSLNDLCPLLNIIGCDKNSEPYRKLYRDMGYSLSGYWEIFYWDMNNEEASEYKPPAKAT